MLSTIENYPAQKALSPQGPFVGNFRRPPDYQDAQASSLGQLLVTSLALVLLATGLLAPAIVCIAGSPLDLPYANGSELNLESRGLEAVPVVQLCSMMVEQVDRINVVSLANNRIKNLEVGIFQCAATSLVLRILILRNNEINRIARGAFDGLGSLQVLLLDNNRLVSIPSNEIFKPMKSLRHLNLANNQIEFLNDETFASENSNLISLNLNGNPLHRLASNSLLHLVKLKTLTLSQSALSGHLTVLNGLPELRYYHLDRGENLRFVPANLCQSSRKISSLVLKSNLLEQVPQFQHCQSLLLLDLSYNRIQGTLMGNFSLQINLIDLYLGHNQIEAIDENAFVGLKRLQVLELNNNNLKHIHANAFLPIRATIHELNLSNNHQLSVLTGLGLDQLASFKSFGNRQLRRLPRFKSISWLALTYAYHCCDYLPTNGHGRQPETGQIADEGSLIAQLFASALNNIRLLFPGTTDRSSFGEQNAILKLSTPDNDTTNLADIVLWPKTASSASAVINQLTIEPQYQGPEHLESQNGRRSSIQLNFDLWQTETIGEKSFGRGEALEDPQSEGNSSRPEAVVGKLRRRAVSGHSLTAANKHHHHYNVHLIDELLEEAKQIRLDHSVELLNRIPGHRASERGLVSSLRADSANEHQGLIEFWSRYVRGDDGDAISNVGEPYGRHWSDHRTGDTVARVLSGMLVPKRDARRLIRRDIVNHSQQKPLSRASEQVTQCLPAPSSFFPCRDLFDTWWLRAGVWCVFLLAFTGNILVIVVLSSVRQSSSSSALTNIMWLAHSKRHIDVPRFLVINLAIADLIMALYLGILAFVDLTTLGEFKMFAIKWQYSTGCKLASFLGVLSSELSIFILAIITLERNYAITNAVHLNRRLSLHKAMVIMFIGYAFAFMMAIMPLNGISDYRKFSICLPLDMDSNFYSHIYVIALICINAFSFILLLSCYLRMYCAIRGSQAWNTNDLRIAKRMSILVLTDFLCWMPIIVAGIGSLFGHHLIDSNGLKILTIFILPLNSVANPFLYAITTKKFKRDLNTLLQRFRRMLSWVLCSSGANTKDPNVFPNYNNYHRNMMTMMDKNRRPYAKSDQSPYGRHQLNRGRQLTRTAGGGQTAEQLTINRTTYSCRRVEYQRQLATSCDGGIGQHQVTKPLPRPSNQSIDEPSLPAQIHQPFDETLGCLTTNSPSFIPTGSSPATKIPRTLITDSRTELRPRSVHRSGVIVCSTGDIVANTRFLVSSVTSPGKLDEHPTPGNDVGPQRHLLSVCMQQTNRSASACGFSANPEAGTAGDHPEARASGSCDTMRITGNEHSLEKLSRSINRLLFHPVAKAWSSIQISLNSSATQMGANAAQKTDILQEERSSSANKSIDSDQLYQDSTTMDDLLMVSGGSQPSGRQLFKSNERRMSRSCDYIKTSPTSIILMSPTSSGHEPTTSQGDYDDDERILLATIGQMTANKYGCLPIQSGRQTRNNMYATEPQYARNRCTRCRSWSPALLGKLEDCIYQIKCRIPGLGAKEECHVGQQEKNTSKRYLDQQCESADNQHTDLSNPSYQPENMDKLNSQTGSDEDQFDDDNPLDLNPNRSSLIKRSNYPRLNRLRQQSSGNSDTLSTRTGGTIITNMSASFDSNTNIPNQIGQQNKDVQGE